MSSFLKSAGMRREYHFFMDITDRLFVELHPLTSGQIPHPTPIDDAHFDPSFIYKVLGMYNASETSECYFILANPQRQIWFIPQRHLLAYGLIDSDELFLPLDRASRLHNGHGRVDTLSHTGFRNTPDPISR